MVYKKGMNLDLFQEEKDILWQEKRMIAWKFAYKRDEGKALSLIRIPWSLWWESGYGDKERFYQYGRDRGLS